MLNISRIKFKKGCQLKRSGAVTTGTVTLEYFLRRLDINVLMILALRISTLKKPWTSEIRKRQ